MSKLMRKAELLNVRKWRPFPMNITSINLSRGLTVVGRVGIEPTTKGL
jgi:hypothetical protein